MEMMLVLVNLGLSFLFGIYLSFYFFFNRIVISSPLRWLGGIVGGLIIGSLMAIIDFWIIWPPASILSVIAGLGLMILIVKILIGFPKLGQSNNA
ncbi:MAG: hypothetical protein WA131_10390 [Desulfitobacteriaceae bacterium]